jgi:hypothetical protein
MQPLRRNIPLTRTILAAFLLLLCSGAPQIFAQSAPQLSPILGNAVHTLANKIAAAAGTMQTLSLDVKNISSLSASDASAARQALEADLVQRRLRLVPPPSAPSADAPLQIRVTFSEGVESLVWIAEIRSGDGSDNERQVAIVTVSKLASNILRAAEDSLNLDKKLIWEQPEMFVDFATLPQSAGTTSTLLILEPSRLAFYRSPNGPISAQPIAQWQLWQSVNIAHSSVRTRNVVGNIDVANRSLSLAGVDCTGDFLQPQSFKCTPANRQSGVEKVEIPGREGAEGVSLAAKCTDGNVLLGTGTGDWTQTDSIQGFELANASGQPIPSGDPIAMDGPVISMAASTNASDARTVIYNLKTGHYEGYVVTATCNR